MANIIGTNGNDTLVGSNSADTIKGLAGNDTITANYGNDTLTGGGGKDQFVYNFDDYNLLSDGTDIITDFGGVGQGTNPTAAVIAQVDTIKFLGAGFTARNLLLTQNGNNLEVTFEGVPDAKVILQNFKLENLENLKASKGRSAIGNILFDGQTSIIDSFHVLDANSTETTLRIKNTVTFFNDLDNNITGLDNSNDVVNGQGGNDKINGLSGNDLLRGGAGNDILLGGVGNDILLGGAGKNILKGDVGNDSLGVNYSTGNNLLDGGVGNDNLSVGYSSGNNLLNGGDGNDYLAAYDGDNNKQYDRIPTLGNNTLNGGAGIDHLNVGYSSGNNLLNGGDGNDDLSASGTDGRYNTPTSGNNTLNGGAGDDRLSAFLSTGNNLLFGGEGNDTIYGSVSGNDTIDGGKGDDLLFYYGARGAITSTFNATNNISSITVGTNRVSYKNIERLYIRGTEYDDLIVGSNGNDMIDGGSSGNDTIDGGTGDDLLSYNFYKNDNREGITSTFNATTNIGSITVGTNRVSYKNIERLDIRGTQYDDLIVGSNGDDTLNGSNGNDILIGGKGNDSLIGGSGTDTFAFNSFNQGIDRLDDFKATNELIQVTADGFGGGLSIGSLKTSQFTIGTSATAIAQRFIYDNDTGGLFFDQDGSASGFTQVQFAQLSAGLSLTEKNFLVV
ncbi:hemolysin-type calcium-binding region [Nostoc commune NIES-4072]|uniref:Hemolysin-type calcium-binding region n=1 Tax=Nostoc commune NIES-4072 TaxID=2005467 RepID=A0A2R5FL92_NOSCO|nr:calcium-binding protein [Nostoc commune]BBD69449.1 hemolysin-type calcium-binding region [Nostoc commune HK-02]GBG19550.1 hemolysin-type calcium-binding region [Nostoc commune NIES-4072]